MSIVRKRNAFHKAYLPSNARDNHYLLAEFPLTDKLIEHFKTINSHQASNLVNLYEWLSEKLFELSNKFEVKNSLFIANDKLARVRYSQEMHQWQTDQQILFYYNPAYHELKKSFYDGNYKARKITLLFLATGNDIRVDAAGFHAKITQLLKEYEQSLQIGTLNYRLRDHQHLTYDLFEKQKTGIVTKAHKMRTINVRYASQDIDLPESQRQMTYAIVNLPVKTHLINLADIDKHSDDPYNPLYALVTDVFTMATKQYNLNNGALIANDLIPIVRKSRHEIISSNGELQTLGYNPELSPCGFISKWDAKVLVDNIQLVFVATKDNQADSSHAKFLNQVEAAVKLMTNELKFTPQQDEVIIRFHQHIAYNLVENND